MKKTCWVVWCGVVRYMWYGEVYVVWCGVVWCGVVLCMWCGVGCGVVYIQYCGVQCDVVRCVAVVLVYTHNNM